MARLQVSLQRAFLCILSPHSLRRSTWLYRTLRKKGTQAPPVKYGEKIITNPIDWITSVLVQMFGSKHVSLTKCNSPAKINDTSGGKSKLDLDIVVMDCILARSIKIHKVKRRKAAKPLDTPVKMFTYIGLHRAQRTTITLPADTSIAGIGSDKNWKQNCLGLLPVKTPVDDSFRACIVLIPNAGVFYCHRERRKETAGVTNSYIPMDINWLRLCCNSKSTSVLNNWFSEGSYVLRIADGDCCVWKWSVQRSESNLLPANCGIVGLTPGLRDKCIHKMYQLTDEDSPALSPDFVDSKDLSTWVECDRLTGLYRRAYCKSNSARRGCRHYARGFPHKNMDPKATFVIDPTKCTEMDLLCCGAHQTLQQKGGIAPTLSGSDLLPTCCCW
jgi:hypothetical protein